MKVFAKNRVLLWFFLVLAGIHFLEPPRLFWKSLLAYINLTLLEGAWRPLCLLTREPGKESITLQSDGRSLGAYLYTPRPLFPPAKSYPSIVLFSPLVLEGKSDPRLQNLANTLARLGFAVLLADRSEQNRIFLSSNDFTDLRTSWKYLRDHPLTDDGRVALFGFSYGTGPMLISAATVPVMRDHVPYLVAFGGFADIKNFLRFALTGAYGYKDIQGYRHPDKRLREATQANLKTFIGSSSERESFLANRDPARFDELYARLPTSFRESLEAYSPCAKVPLLRMPLLLVHSTDDPVIPYTESIRLSEMALNAPCVWLSLVSVFGHGEYKPLTWSNFWRFFVPSFFDSYRFLYRLLWLGKRKGLRASGAEGFTNHTACAGSTTCL